MDKTEPGRVGAYGRVLPGFTEDDIIGSPYAVVEYVVNEDIGGDEALQEFRKKLSNRGIKLMLDLVPNVRIIALTYIVGSFEARQQLIQAFPRSAGHWLPSTWQLTLNG
mmetsp:Transcript_14802/g.60168  ORF Transcript_14802/g.60168 Transcript_14802/m.60168 type:complete len:109 (+) Transcript_14802:352-678(+)